MDELTLVGAYGRTYKSKAAALADWKDGKDFRIVHGPYCSIRDVERLKSQGVRTLYFREGNKLLAFINL